MASAGFALLCLWALFLLTGGGYLSFRLMEEINLWGILYLYGAACSIIIDMFVRYFPSKRTLKEGLLYAFFGYCYFPAAGYLSKGAALSARELLGTLFIAGTLGAITALIFWAGGRLAANHRRTSYLMGIVIPGVLFLSMTIVNDLKMGWKETFTNSTYEAAFDSFNGAQEIPVELRKGQTLVFGVLWNVKGGSSTGHHVLKPNGGYAALQTTTDHRTAISAEEDGVYRIVAQARGGGSGSFKVTWEIRD